VAGPDLPGPATIAPNKPLKALDTTGAGDSFDAAFVLCMLRGLTPADAGKLANTWASGTIMRLGARTDRRMSNGLSLYDVGGIVE
jgi:sugar/nucleoside kinase (ribokinase family)